MARDDFPPSVIRKLKDRVNLRCSNPSCRVPTSAPSSKSNDAVNNTGIAAHICAASEGGARYKTTMTSKERKSIDNAIWLCAICSIKIDRDEESYKEEILREWKYKAEEAATSEQGTRLPGKDDAVNMLTVALTGAPVPKRLIVDAIANTHRASEKSLEALDPRFEIKTAHSENRTCFEIRAKENVPIEMNINKNYAEEFFHKFNGFVEHGEDVKIDTCAISFEKSPLFEELLSQITKGVLHFSPHKKIQAVQKLWVRDPATNIVDAFDDVIGEIYAGTKSFTFKGRACNGLFNLTLKKELESMKSTVNITLSLSTRNWDQFDICSLPYFDKLLSFFSKLVNGCELNIALEIEGKQIIASKGEKIDKWDNIIWIYDFLKYIERCRIVSEFTNVKLLFSSDVSYTEEEHRNIYDIVDILQGNQVYTKDELSSNWTCELVVDSGSKNIELLNNIKEPLSIEFKESKKEQIKLFKTTITLPRKIVSIKSVLPKIDNDIAILKEGDVVTVEWIPCDDFSCEVYYEKKK
jgi:hypothetical protein